MLLLHQCVYKLNIYNKNIIYKSTHPLWRRMWIRLVMWQVEERASCPGVISLQPNVSALATQTDKLSNI